MLNLSFSRFFLVLILISCLSSSNVFSLSLYQESKINIDRSGSLKLNYWESTSKIKDSEFFDSTPFTEDKIREIFSSENNVIDKITISKNNPDTTFVNVFITFKDILKINTAPGFSKTNLTWYVTADSITFLCKFEKNNDYAKFSPAIFKFELPAKEILRSSGKKENNSFSVKVDSEYFQTGTTIFAVFKKSDNDNSSIPSNENESVVIENENSESNKKCGLFSIELPILILFGLFYNKRNYRKNR